MMSAPDFSYEESDSRPVYSFFAEAFICCAIFR